MSVFKCKMCGGTIEFEQGASIGVCDSCGTRQTLPRLDDDRKANLYDRANHFRRNNDFDKAMGIYEQILNEDSTDAETYWSLVLCRYGIEYVEDPATHKRVPTVNRAQFTSIFADEDYKSALRYADSYQKAIYEDEARVIDEIQRGILEISEKEEPFDVFISYKETDEGGRRTKDSVLANDLYHQLTQEGFKVFFSRITLEDKLGTAYEPYIFAALNSAKVMVVLGTRPEYFQAVWMKNEWSRYLALIKNGAKKTLIPAYRDMDPYDLPEEFSHLQAQDMSKLGFMQDLIRGIKKIIGADAQKAAAKETVVISGGSANTAALLKRAFMFLEDGDWDSADEYCEKVLDIDPENASAYLGKLMAELCVSKQEDLKDCEEPFDDCNNYKKAVRFADPALAETLKGTIDFINERNEKDRVNGIYNSAVHIMQSADTEKAYQEASAAFGAIPGFKDADSLAKQCIEKAEVCRKDAIYDKAKASMTGTEAASYEAAINAFQTIPGWKDADEQLYACQKKIEEIKAKAEVARREEERAKRNNRTAIITASVIYAVIAFVIVLTTIIIPNGKYNDAVALMDSGKYEEAMAAFEALGNYKDSAEQIRIIAYAEAETLLAEENPYEAAVAFYAANGYSDARERSFEIWGEITERETVSAGGFHTVGLRVYGTEAAVGYNEDGRCDVSVWRDIVAVSAGTWHTVGLRADGSVAAVGNNEYGQCIVSYWTDIVAVSAGDSHTVGLRADGTAAAVGNNEYGQCDVSDWTDIVAVSAGFYHTVGLQVDGTVVAVGNNEVGQCDVSGWTDIVAVSVGGGHTVGLRADGTVVAVGYNEDGQCDVSDWTDIVAVFAGAWHTVGLRADGTVVAVGYNEDGQCDVSGWTDIAAVSAGGSHTVGLRADGTVTAAGDNEYGQCGVSDWTDIKLP